jgi:endonuclease/exonuclease/phosphatase family metal-dependent hydrolase
MLRVMTYNIRNSGAGDGPNRWELRRDLWCSIVRQFDPDLLGVQEVLADQYDYLKEQFPDYTLEGVARDDGKRQGEWSLILYRTARFEKLKSGNIWLSETPYVCGSKSWDAACCRLCTWVRLKDKDTGRKLLFLNVHLDHVGVVARRESAKFLVRALSMNTMMDAMLLTGDFNSTEVDEPYAILTRFGLKDTYRTIHPTRQGDEASFLGFDHATTGMRIDWILHGPGTWPIETTIDRTRGPDGRCASDHDAVTAVLKWVDGMVQIGYP